MLRLPDGMRERIKAKADRAGMSMNEAVVWCLEQYFPAPVTIEDKLKDLADLVAILKASGPDYQRIDDIYNDLRETLDGVAEKKIKAPESFGQMVWERLHDLDLARLEDERDRNASPFEDDGRDLDDEV